MKIQLGNCETLKKRVPYIPNYSKSADTDAAVNIEKRITTNKSCG